MYDVVFTIDPERFTEFYFGGPHGTRMWRVGLGVLMHENGQFYLESDFHTCWMEGRNVRALCSLTGGN